MPYRRPSRQAGVTLTEVNLAIVLSMLLLIPFIAFYGGMQRLFLNTYYQLNYLQLVRIIGENLQHQLSITDPGPIGVPIADTAALDFPAASVVDYTQPVDKHLQITYTPTKNGVSSSAQTVHYSYDEANEELFLRTSGGPFQSLSRSGLIKAFILQYYDSLETDSSEVPLTPAPIPNPTNVRRVKITMISNPLPAMAVKKGSLTRYMLTPGSNQAFTPTATAAGSVQVSGALTVGQWNGGILAIVAGRGKGQKVGITSNTANQFNVSPTFTTVPDNTSRIQVYHSDFEGTAEAGAAVAGPPYPAELRLGSLQDAQRSWQSNEWMGYYVIITAGRGAGQSGKIVSNTADRLYVISGLRQDTYKHKPDPVNPPAVTNAVHGHSQWQIAPDVTSRYLILPRFYYTEEGTTSLNALTQDYIVDEGKIKHWRQTLYPYKNRPDTPSEAAVPATKDRNPADVEYTFSSYFQGFAVEILTGGAANQVRAISNNCLLGLTGCTDTRLEVYPHNPFSVIIGAGNKYKLIRLGKSATVDIPPKDDPNAQKHYILPDFGQITSASVISNQFQDTSKNWTANYWQGGLVVIRNALRNDGENRGVIGYITSNTNNTLTFSTSPAEPTKADTGNYLERDDGYILLPPDSQPVIAATANTLTLQNPPQGTGYPLNFWEGGYVEVFDPTNPYATVQIRKITANNNLINPPVIIVGENFSTIPTVNYRYRIFHRPLQQMPFTWLSETTLKKITSAGVF